MFIRLFLLMALFGIAVFAVSTMISTAKAMKQTAEGDWMPDTFQRIAYVLLIVLMFGICTGWLGAV